MPQLARRRRLAMCRVHGACAAVHQHYAPVLRAVFPTSMQLWRTWHCYRRGFLYTHGVCSTAAGVNCSTTTLHAHITRDQHCFHYIIVISQHCLQCTGCHRSTYKLPDTVAASLCQLFSCYGLQAWQITATVQLSNIPKHHVHSTV